MKTADVSLDGVDHAGESANLVKAAIGNFGLPLEEGGMDALSTVENFMDVWFMEQNTKKRPTFLQLVATEETLDQLVAEVGENVDNVVVRVALGVLNRLASEPSIASVITAEVRFSKLLREAVKALESKSLQERLMWLETMNSFVGLCPDQELVERIVKETGFLAAILASIKVPEKTEKPEDQIYAELDGMLACKTISLLCEVGSEELINSAGREGLQKQLTVLHEHKDWAHSEAVGLHALLLLKAHTKMNAQWKEMDKEVELAGVTIQEYSEKGVRGCVSYVKYFNPVCSKCGKGDEKLLKCGRCHAVKYCSRDCQKADWVTHRQLCGKATGNAGKNC